MRSHVGKRRSRAGRREVGDCTDGLGGAREKLEKRVWGWALDGAGEDGPTSAIGSAREARD